MAGKIFINYRRDDDAAGAARVRDGLASKFGKANLFIDVDNLFAGQRFDEELARALVTCDVLVAVIGRHWMDLLKAKIASGERDHVREEIAAALQRRIVVIPVRVGREGQLPPLPRVEDLPPDISDLVLHQKHDVTHERFGRDIAELVEAIKVVRRLNRPKSAVRLFFFSFGPVVHWGFIGIGAMAVLMLIISYKDLNKMFPDPGASRVATTEQSRDRKRAEAEAKQRTDEEAEAKAEEDRKRAEAEAKQRADEAARRDPALSVTPGSGEAFQDRLADGEPCPMCPEMVVAPAGTFTMGSPPGERGRDPGEVQVPVTIARPFAVGKYAVIDQWDACAADIVCIAGLRPERPAPTPDYW